LPPNKIQLNGKEKYRKRRITRELDLQDLASFFFLKNTGEKKKSNEKKEEKNSHILAFVLKKAK
jgi:hypothetical protein